MALAAIGAAYMSRFTTHVVHDERTKLTYLVRYDRWTDSTSSELLFPTHLAP